jgi:hypothetical protein
MYRVLNGGVAVSPRLYVYIIFGLVPFVPEMITGDSLQLQGAGPGVQQNINGFRDVAIPGCS